MAAPVSASTPKLNVVEFSNRSDCGLASIPKSNITQFSAQLEVKKTKVLKVGTLALIVASQVLLVATPATIIYEGEPLEVFNIDNLYPSLLAKAWSAVPSGALWCLAGIVGTVVVSELKTYFEPEPVMIPKSPLEIEAIRLAEVTSKRNYALALAAKLRPEQIKLLEDKKVRDQTRAKAEDAKYQVSASLLENAKKAGKPEIVIQHVAAPKVKTSDRETQEPERKAKAAVTVSDGGSTEEEETDIATSASSARQRSNGRADEADLARRWNALLIPQGSLSEEKYSAMPASRARPSLSQARASASATPTMRRIDAAARGSRVRIDPVRTSAAWAASATPYGGSDSETEEFESQPARATSSRMRHPWGPVQSSASVSSARPSPEIPSQDLLRRMAEMEYKLERGLPLY